MGSRIRKAAVAGMFYPADAGTLSSEVDDYLRMSECKEPAPKAMIVPHAGYIYSGPIAASAYARLTNAQNIECVVLLGPAHRVGFYGLAVPDSHFFETPLGQVEIDIEAIKNLVEKFPQVILDDRPHAEEHSLEVHLPFLQRTLGDFKLIPLVVGQATVDEVAEVINECWGGSETLIVISSDLSHYHNYATATKLDSETSTAIETLQGQNIGPEDACGFLPVRGLLKVAQEKNLQAEMIDQRNSGDTVGDKNRVVGYGAYLFN